MIFVYVPDVDQVIGVAIEYGARLLVPAQNQFWGDRSAVIMDPNGHVWTVASRIEGNDGARANRSLVQDPPRSARRLNLPSEID